MNFWEQKTFCLVTGASRGIGKTIAIEFAKNVEEGSVFVLVARTATALEETKKVLLSETGGKCQVVTAALDLEKPDKNTYFKLINSALEQTGKTTGDFDHSILVHNAASLGNTSKKVEDMDDLVEIQNYLTLNITSMLVLNSQFFKIFNDNSPSKQRSVVQITSLSAVEPMKTMGFYCSGKACRDMLMKSLALESEIQVLNWAPGPVETEMYEQACTKTADPEINKLFNETREKGQVLTTIQTVSKLVKVLGEKKFVKGEHVDYFEIE